MRFWYREENGRDRRFEEVHWQYAYREDEICAMLASATGGPSSPAIRMHVTATVLRAKLLPAMPLSVRESPV